ncbi:MAG: L-seryl-tRNA(Sec) selenium transferase [Planctomycetes bacterium]|nr:L-seryl-tRNA(Sec) selenium transferase [Planctomycetota bacterium]
MNDHPFRDLPSVNELLNSEKLAPLFEHLSRQLVIQGVRETLDDIRNRYSHSGQIGTIPSLDRLVQQIHDRFMREDRKQLVPVINATGILLHTGLGRAPLASEAIDAIMQITQGYSNVELNLSDGERSNRHLLVRKLICDITGSESALVVNNNAGATVVVLSALARNRGVLVSRGQLVEIGGSFRLPEIMEVSGTQLVEVGTTNKTRIGDYQSAIDDSIAAIMRIHTSNYRVVGFTEEASLESMVSLGKKHGLPVIDDIGSGALVDFAPFGFDEEPLVHDSIKQGADVVLFSGDKLLGGPQAGIIVGKKTILDRIEKHPLMRALRVDKMTFAALEATLRLYRNPKQACQHIPLLSLLTTPLESLHTRARTLTEHLQSLDGIATAETIRSNGFLGGGSLPDQQLTTWCTTMVPRHLSLEAFSQRLRTGSPAVVGRIQDGKFLLDHRTVFPRQDRQLIDRIDSVLSPGPEKTSSQ